MVVVAIYFCFPGARERSSPAPLWKYLSFTQNLGLNLQTQGTFSHAWSLCIEEQFYLLLPLILIVMVYYKIIKKGWLLLVTLFLLGFAARWFVYNTIVQPGFQEEGGWLNWYKWIYYPTYSRLDGLLTGVAIAALFQFRPMIKEKITVYGNLLLVVSTVLLAGAFYICADEASFTASVFGFLLISIGYGCMIMGAISPHCFLYKRPSAITAKLAALSYAIYLTHKIIIHLTQAQFSKQHIAKESGWVFVVCVITCLAGAWLINTFIENPFLQLREKVLDKLPKYLKVSAV